MEYLTQKIIFDLEEKIANAIKLEHWEKALELISDIVLLDLNRDLSTLTTFCQKKLASSKIAVSGNYPDSTKGVYTT